VPMPAAATLACRDERAGERMRAPRWWAMRRIAVRARRFEARSAVDVTDDDPSMTYLHRAFVMRIEYGNKEGEGARS